MSCFSAEAGQLIEVDEDKLLVHKIGTRDNVYFKPAELRHENCAPSVDPEPKLTEKARVFQHTALALCEHHKRTCDGTICNVSLGPTRAMAEAAGAVFTSEEAQSFM